MCPSEVGVWDAMSGWMFQRVHLCYARARLPPGSRGFPGERPGLLEAACLGLGHRMGVCQYFNNQHSWTSSNKAHIDPQARGVHRCRAVWSSPSSANSRGAGLQGWWGAPAPSPHPSSFFPSPPGSCLNTLKQSKSNYHEQAAWEHLLHPSPGITNAPVLSADRRWAPRASRVARCSRATAPPSPPATWHGEGRPSPCS